MRPNLLILGGTAEASRLAVRIADAGIDAVLSYAGRTQTPKSQPIPTRVGGFGGAAGLARYLQTENITHLVDATHPFAAQISHNAAEAAAQADVPLVALTRPAWSPEPGDSWTEVTDIDAAIAALDGPARRIFLAIGRTEVAEFSRQPQHSYLLRFVDAPAVPPPLPQHQVVVDRGPFTEDGDMALLQAHAVELVVSKNSGGAGARAKLDAARQLGLPVMMIARPPTPDRVEVTTLEAVMDWVASH